MCKVKLAINMMNDDGRDEENFNENGENLPLKTLPTITQIPQETTTGSSENGKNWQCNGHFMEKMSIVVFLWISFFLCNLAFSAISPFFPKVVR